MRARGTLVLLLAVMVAGGALWLEGMPELESKPPPGADATPIVPLFAGDPESLAALEISRGDERLRLERPASGWQETAEGKKAGEFLEALTHLGRIQELTVEKSDWGEFGLEPAPRRVVLERGSERPMVIELGNRNPSTTGIYVRIDDSEKVLLIGALLEWEFDKLWRALRPAENPPPSPVPGE